MTAPQDPTDAATASVPAAQVADLGARVIAFVIDALIAWVPYNLAISGILYRIFGELGVLAPFLVALVYGAVVAAYFVYFWTERGATLGMQLLRLEVVSEDGARLKRTQAVTRFLYLGLPTVLAIVFSGLVGLGFALGPGVALGALGIVGLLVVVATLVWNAYLAYTTASDPNRQGVHDRAARSLVVRARG